MVLLEHFAAMAVGDLPESAFSPHLLPVLIGLSPPQGQELCSPPVLFRHLGEHVNGSKEYLSDVTLFLWDKGILNAVP